MNTSLTIIIVHYNVESFLEQCLASVRKASAGLTLQVIVVDNASSVDPAIRLGALYPEVSFRRNAVNRGFAAANNQALEESRGRYILLLNPDTLVGESSFRYLCSFMDAHPEAGAAGVKMLDARGRFHVESKRGFPTLWGSFCKLFGLVRLFPRAGYDVSYLSEDKVLSVEVLSGACMLIRRQALDKAGVLDEAFFMYGEDIDLSWRIRKAGYLNYFLPLRLLHYKGESSRQGDWLYIRSFYGAMLIFFSKYYPWSSRFFGWLIWIGVGLKMVQACLCKALVGIKPWRRPKARRMLVAGSAAGYEKARELCLRQMPQLLSVEHSSAERSATADPSITDLTFISPDLSFEEMLRQMEQNYKATGGRITHHVYHTAANILLSPTK